MTIVVFQQIDTKVPFTDFLPEVLPYVHDCPQLVAINAIRNAAIEFCEKSHYWQLDIDPMNVEAGEGNFIVPCPEGTVFIDAKMGWMNGRQLHAKSVEELTRMYRSMDFREAIGSPAYITRVRGDEVILVPRPDRTQQAALTIRAVVAPARNATFIEKDVYEKFLEAIAKGARARLHSTPGQPYYDMTLSVMYQREFMVAIGEAKIKANKGLSRASVAIEYPGFN